MVQFAYAIQSCSFASLYWNKKAYTSTLTLENWSWILYNWTQIFCPWNIESFSRTIFWFVMINQ